MWKQFVNRDSFIWNSRAAMRYELSEMSARWIQHRTRFPNCPLDDKNINKCSDDLRAPAGITSALQTKFLGNWSRPQRFRPSIKNKALGRPDQHHMGTNKWTSAENWLTSFIKWLSKVINVYPNRPKETEEDNDCASYCDIYCMAR